MAPEQNNDQQRIWALNDRIHALLDQRQEAQAQIERLRNAVTDLLHAEAARPSCQAGAVPRCMCLKCAKERARAALTANDRHNQAERSDALR